MKTLAIWKWLDKKIKLCLKILIHFRCVYINNSSLMRKNEDLFYVYYYHWFKKNMLLSSAFPENLLLHTLKPAYSVHTEIRNNPIICKYISQCPSFANGMPILLKYNHLSKWAKHFQSAQRNFHSEAGVKCNQKPSPP